MSILLWPRRTFWSSATVARLAIRMARWWRPRMRQALVVGVTGSAGKSTTRHIVDALLCRHLGAGVSTPAASRYAFSIAEAVLALRPRHRFLAAEMHEGKPGLMRQIAGMLKPDVVIVTVARDDHASAFTSKEALFDEMRELVRQVPAHGTAILNADDPIVAAMRACCRGTALSYGMSPDADLRAELTHADWPGRLQLTLVHGQQRQQVRTRMLSEHWIPAVLAAAACATVAGMTLAEIASTLEEVEPFEGRMQECRSRDGVIFIRDEFKAPQWTLPSCFEFLRRAKAPRKMLVLGEISDVEGSKPNVLQALARAGLGVADAVVVVGPWSSAVLKLKHGEFEQRLHAFTRTRDASAFVNAWLKPGELVLLKGSNKQNHLARILMERDGEIRCWRDDCQRDGFCNACDERLRVVGPPVAALQAIQAEPAFVSQASRPDFALLGLGNAEEPRFVNTPHNIGFALVDHLAAHCGGTWQESAWGWHTDIDLQTHRLRLMKMRSTMNQIGPKLMPLLATLNFGAERCILAFDDAATPLGKVKLRERGSAGGHRGVASILEAAQTDTFPRLKLGVAPPQQERLLEYVLRPFAPEAAPSVQAMLLLGEERLLALLQDLKTRAAAKSATAAQR